MISDREKGGRPGDFSMGLLLFDRNVQELCPRPHPAQPRPAQRFFFFCVLGGGEGKGRGGSGWRVRRIRQPKEPWQAGTSSDGALDVLQPKHQGYLPSTLLLSFFVDALFIRLLLLLLLPLLLLLFCNYACEGVDWIITELSGRTWVW